MKKKVLIIVSVIVILFAVVGGMIIHKKTVKPIVIYHCSIGEFYDFYSLKIQIYENGKCKLIGENVGRRTVSYKIEKNKIEELQQKIEELKFRDISENINTMIDCSSTSITVNYKDKQSYTVCESYGFKNKRRTMGKR